MKKLNIIIPIFVLSQAIFNIPLHAQTQNVNSPNESSRKNSTSSNNQSNYKSTQNYSNNNTNNIQKNTNNQNNYSYYSNNNSYSSSKYSQNNQYYRDYKVGKVDSPKNVKVIYDENKRKIFDKDINIPENKVEYLKKKEFVSTKIETLKRLEKIKFEHLSKNEINSFKKQIQTMKPTFSIEQFEKTLQKAIALDKVAKNTQFITNIVYLVLTILGYILFKFYTKRFIYRIENIENIPTSKESDSNIDMDKTQIINVVPVGEDSNLLETINVTQTLYANDSQIGTTVNEVKEDFDLENWLFSSEERKNNDTEKKENKKMGEN